MKNEIFSENRIFQYNRAKKFTFGITVIISFLALTALIISYVFFISRSDFFVIDSMNQIIMHIMSNITSSTLTGMFYTSLFGGLFFFFLPLEILFMNSLRSGNPFILVTLLYLAGIAVSFSIDYFIGRKLSSLARKIISPKQFYNTKSKVNRYGPLAIFIFNALPLPSQPLSAILGVFRYNITRFYVFVFLGQITKCIVIGIGVYFIF